MNNVSFFNDGIFVHGFRNGKGVDFRVCAITLKRRNIDPKKVIDEAVIVPSGVAEVAKLQFKEGYAYLRP